MKSSIPHLFFPPSITLLIKQLGIVFGALTVTRIVFFLLNTAYFKEATLLDFLLGLRFDASTVAYFFSAFIILSLLPLKLQRYKGYRILLAVLYFLPLTVILLMNLSDAVYFRFIFRRSTFDVLRYFSSPAADGWRLLSTFAIDFWYVPALFLFFLLIAVWAYRKAGRTDDVVIQKEGWKSRLVMLLIAAGLIILGGRGGVQLIPITLIDAGIYTTPRSMPLVLNTPFSFMVTAFQQKQEPLHYFSTQEAERYFSPRYEVKPYATSFKGKNVVILILESFGQEYIGYFNKEGGYTPFLDSLFEDSYVFVNAFSNGKQSVDAVPAILSGIPSLMQQPFSASAYAANRIPSLGAYFDELGYHTQFFHGGVNGTMGFEAFSQSAGMQHYYGKSQYPEVERDYDGHWGIFDEPYLNYFAHELSKNDKPFFSVLFTLSSHHPYTIPAAYTGKFPKGKYEIHESIGYADYALRQFFKEAKNQPWFKNTLFVITADHTAHSDNLFYQHGWGMGMYAVPIVFYDPNGSWKGVDSTIIQHIDLFPTLISLTGGDVKGKFFGRNALDKKAAHEVLNYNYGGLYQYLRDSTQATFDGEKVVALTRFTKGKLPEHNMINEDQKQAEEIDHIIKARIQAFYENMEGNTWWK